MHYPPRIHEKQCETKCGIHQYNTITNAKKENANCSISNISCDPASINTVQKDSITEIKDADIVSANSTQTANTSKNKMLVK